MSLDKEAFRVQSLFPDYSVFEKVMEKISHEIGNRMAFPKDDDVSTPTITALFRSIYCLSNYSYYEEYNDEHCLS